MEWIKRLVEQAELNDDDYDPSTHQETTSQSSRPVNYCMVIDYKSTQFYWSYTFNYKRLRIIYSGHADPIFNTTK